MAVGRDVIVAALLIEKGVALFAGVLGTWLPLGLIFSATYLTGKIIKFGEETS
jgi:hypothetical protein